jgi:flagellar biosynthesis anti-sigma factor FlgM
MTNPISSLNASNVAADAIERKRAERLARSLQEGGAGVTEATGKPAPGAAAVGDQLQLSAVAQQAAREPQFDRAKFEAIKEAVAKGEYVVDHRKAAEAFLDLEKLIKD